MGLFDAFKKKDNGSEATLDPAKQLRVKFGTKEPIPFVDSETGVKMELKAFGNAIFAVQDTSAYQSEEQAMEKAQEQLRMAQDPAYAEAKRVREEAEAMQEQMAAARAMKPASSETVEPVKAASVDGSAMPVTGSTRPKFCPNCGTPSGTDKFCRNCGHAFGA